MVAFPVPVGADVSVMVMTQSQVLVFFTTVAPAFRETNVAF
jgi:hypothetical protein